MRSFRDFIEDFCESEKHRALNFAPVGIGLGICLYFSLDSEPNFWLGATLLMLSFCLSIFAKSNRWIFYTLLTISFGFFVSQLRTKTVDTVILNKKNNRPISLTATVESCEKTEKGLKFVVDNVSSKKLPKANKLVLTWRGKKAQASKKDYVPGATVLFHALLSPSSPQNFANAYDFKKQQYFKGISARGFVAWAPKVLQTPETTARLFVERLRHSIDKKIEEYLPQDTASVAKALITGNQSAVSKEVRQNFANSGTAHLLAISGLHMGIIGFFIFWLFRVLLCCIPRVSMFYDVKKISAVISWLVVWCYLNISGSSVPSVRAFIMHTIIICTIWLDRRSLTMRSVAIAATIIMIRSPEVILFPSFQMSFGAVIAIVALYERRWNFTGFFKTLFDVMATTVVASIPTAIFSMSAFNQLTLNSIPANIASIPLMSFFVMPTAVVALFLMPFGWAQPFVILMGFGVKALMKISEWSAQLPGSHFVMPTPTPTNMAIFIFSGLLLTLIQHKIRFLGILGSLAGCVYYCLNPTPDIFVSPNAKVIGIKTKDAACFTHLGHFRSATSAWARSIGFEKREKFDSKVCKKCISQISDDTYVLKMKNQKITLTSDKDYFSKFPDAIFLDKNDDFAQTIYLPSRERVSNKSKTRPWS